MGLHPPWVACRLDVCQRSFVNYVYNIKLRAPGVDKTVILREPRRVITLFQIKLTYPKTSMYALPYLRVRGKVVTVRLKNYCFNLNIKLFLIKVLGKQYKLQMEV